MKTLIIVASLGASTGIASADVGVRPCQPTGTPIFEIDRLGPSGKQLAKVFASGSWTFDETDADGKPGRHADGCFGPAEMKPIRDDLKAAKWTISHPKFHCMAISPNYTVYKVDDKPVYESHVCGTDILDDASAKSVADLEKLLAVAWQAPPRPAEPPIAYACKPSSTVVFAIDHRTVTPKDHSTSTTKLFDNGAWATVAGTTETVGCLAKDDFGKLHDELAAAPWKITSSRPACRAMSAAFTVYSYGGKVKYTARTCGDILDEKSTAVIADVEKRLAP